VQHRSLCFCNYYFVRSNKFANNSAATEARDKMSSDFGI
jgi:hypothetical protein